MVLAPLAEGAARERLGAFDRAASLEGILDGCLVGFAGGGDGQPLGSEGLFVVDHHRLGLAAAELVIREREAGGGGCSRVSTRTSESSRASAREASEPDSSVSRFACCWR